MVKIRLKRFGRTNRPCYRIVAADVRAPRDGRALDEGLGHYDPLEPDNAKKVTLNRERILQWLDRGAQPTDTVGTILKRNGIHFVRKSRSARRKKGQKPQQAPQPAPPSA